MGRSPAGPRTRLFTAASRALHATGLLSLARPLVYRTRLAGGAGAGLPRLERRASPNAQILVYHQVNDGGDPYYGGIPTALFDRQMEYLAAHFRVFPMRDLARGLADGSLPPNAAAVTLDDGYRDNYVHALPILKRHAIPATIFLATSAIGSDRALWHDEVFSAFRETRAPSLRPFGPRGIEGTLASVPERLGVQRRVLGYLRAAPDAERAEAIARLREALGVGPMPPVPGLMLSWEEARAMSREGIRFGSHTASHPILSRVDAARARRELIESKAVIERELDAPVDGFAYPNGTLADFSSETKALLREIGYPYAVTTIAGANDATTDPYELRRGTPWDEDVFAFGVRMLYNKWRS